MDARATVWGIGLLLGGGAIGYAVHSVVSRLKLATAHRNAAILLDNARREAEVLLREARVHAKDEALKARDEVDKENWARRQELRTVEDRLAQREALLDRKAETLDRREHAIDERQAGIEALQRETDEREARLADEERRVERELARVAGIPAEDARRILLDKLKTELAAESDALLRRQQEEVRARADREAKRIITMAVERYAAETVNDITTTTVALPNDDMKGRIIGREGRNIRAFEAATGVNLLIDDTPEIVVLSAFDPMRREIAKRALERLIADGRIHPTRIEEAVEKVRSEIDDLVRATGEEAVYELGLGRVDPAVAERIGRLRFRHSYGQNVLKHSIEMAHLMAMMAGELGLDPAIARRCGLLHDIGKAMDPTAEGGHAVIGAEFLRKHGESPVVVNAVAAHHEEVEAETLYATLVRAADAMTAARPGARQEQTELYLKRLEKLEQIALDHPGVEKCFAIQAGREIRVIVEPGRVDDSSALALARDISRRIEAELDYPGQIKVTVVRETRCVEYAR